MKILVTGGAGFIGSNFILHLMKEYPSYRVVNLDKLTYAGNLENLKDIEGDTRYSFVKGDIGDGKLVEEILRDGVDAIVNFAAESHVDRSILEPAPFIRTNILGTHFLLEAARSRSINKFLQVSTDEVYGSLGPGAEAFTETTPYAPNSPYAASKRCQ
jgi:dTDP-glucose 4,6-dehydratase